MSARTLLVGLLVVYADTCQAGLGDAPSKFGKQVLATRTATKSSGLTTYTELEKKLDSGTAIHEYLDVTGTVFAVSWSGPFLPDLKEVLGPHFDTMVAHVNNTPHAGRSRLVVTRDDVVIISGGHMGAFKGQAWIPAKLPAGFKPADIK